MSAGARVLRRIPVRPPATVELMLLATIVLWALGISLARYILTHGFQPLSFTSTRYGAAAVAFVLITLASERTLRIERAHLRLVLGAALALYLNQLAFVYAVKTTSASLVALLLAAVPIFAALIGLVLRTEQLSRRFWIGAAISFVGVGLVVLGTGDEIGHDHLGVLYGLVTAASWAVYSVIIAPLMRIYSPARISAVVLPLAWIPITLTGLPQLQSQRWDLGFEVWVAVRIRDDRPADPHELPVVPLARPRRPGARHAGHEPAAVRGRALRGRAAARVALADPGRGRRADRRGDPRRAAADASAALPPEVPCSQPAVAGLRRSRSP